jgi:hypothetical protein
MVSITPPLAVNGMLTLNRTVPVQELKSMVTGAVAEVPTAIDAMGGGIG